LKKILRQADSTAKSIQHIKVQRKRWYDDEALKDDSEPPDDAPTWAVSTSTRRGEGGREGGREGGGTSTARDTGGREGGGTSTARDTGRREGGDTSTARDTGRREGGGTSTARDTEGGREGGGTGDLIGLLD
jgi:hypothetical protein